MKLQSFISQVLKQFWMKQNPHHMLLCTNTKHVIINFRLELLYYP